MKGFKIIDGLMRICVSALVSIAVLTGVNSNAQELPDRELTMGDLSPKVFRGYYRTVIDGDTVTMLVMNPVKVFAPLKFKNKKEEEFYWKTVRDVRKALPYARLISETLLETYEYILTFPTEAERTRYLKQMESDVFAQYKPHLKRFTKNQAKVLVKLIRRETDQSGYDILKAYLGGARATFWQGFGRLFGVNLKAGYKPDSDRHDAIIERVATLIEQGQL